MAKFCKGDMWTAYKRADLFLITTNSTLKRNGTLVMGRGIARQARDHFPSVDVALGQEIARICGNLGEYGLLVSPRWPEAKLGAFQVKTHYGLPAQLSLTKASVQALIHWCNAHSQTLVCSNFPGVGNGQLNRADVVPLVSRLPDSVWVWEYK